MAKEITLQDVKNAFKGGSDKHEEYRGAGSVDVVRAYPTFEDFLNAKGNSHLKTAYKKELKEQAAKAKAEKELAEKREKAAKEAAEAINE